MKKKLTEILKNYVPEVVQKEFKSKLRDGLMLGLGVLLTTGIIYSPNIKDRVTNSWNQNLKERKALYDETALIREEFGNGKARYGISVDDGNLYSFSETTNGSFKIELVMNQKDLMAVIARTSSLLAEYLKIVDLNIVDKNNNGYVGSSELEENFSEVLDFYKNNIRQNYFKKDYPF